MNKEYLIYKLSDEVKNSCKIDKEAFKKFNVKRGLRNEDGSGVLVGLTNIGNVVGYERDADGKLTPTEGKLYYRGYELDDLVSPLLKEKRCGFEEVAFLLLSGQLPDKEELEAFKELLNDNMPLDHRTITHIIELEGSNIMNILARCVLEMYTFDPNPDDISRDNLMRQSIELIAKFPTIIAYAYNIYRHSVQGRSLHIRHPRENLSIAENFLYMMKHENYSELDDKEFAYIEYYADSIQYNIAKRYMRFSNSAPLVYMTYSILQRIEIDNLKHIVEGIRYNQPVSKIENTLIYA